MDPKGTACGAVASSYEDGIGHLGYINGVELPDKLSNCCF
jgi:hypothetical protein